MLESAYLVMVNIPEEDWSFKIDAQRKRVGRAAEVKIRIPAVHVHVSRQHAEVWRDKDGIWLKDLQSRGGTQINGVWLEKGGQATITTGDRITLGNVELKVVGQVSKLAELMDEADITVRGVDPPERDEEGQTKELNRQHPRDLAQLRLRRLTPAELDIVLWMYRGYTTDEELGRTLYRSPNTIRTQVARIFAKLNLHSRTGIVTWLQRVASTVPPAAMNVRSAALEIDRDATVS